ncbi:MAG: rod shape-determining protein MreC [Erysipelotrichales bacterium]|nr:rod shape-determining protein MreC [Erysipelotrichales bacterium]
MMNFIKNNLIYLILLILFIYKGLFVNIIANINTILSKNNNIYKNQIDILESENKILKEDLETVTNLKGIYSDSYKLTKVSYRLSYNDNEFYITGDNYKANNLLINENGLVGVIKEIKKGYSLCTTIKGVKNLSIKINDSFGTISEYKDNLFIVKDISNYDDVKLNDEVYTSVIGDINNKIYIGYVYSIEEHEVSKTLYIKSKVDFNNLNFLYVVG